MFSVSKTLLSLFLLQQRTTINTMAFSTSTNKFFVLGSGSYTRKLILTNAGYTFSILKADIDERSLGNREDASRASELVLLLANAKADAILPNIPEAYKTEILLTADQVVVHNNRILEKPKDRIEAQHFIDGYGRLPCSTVGSIVLTDIQSGKRVAGVDTATIHFDPIPQTAIDRLLEEGVYQCSPNFSHSFRFQLYHIFSQCIPLLNLIITFALLFVLYFCQCIQIVSPHLASLSLLSSSSSIECRRCSQLCGWFDG